MRSDAWLVERAELLWGKSFADIEKKNRIVVRFKGRWKNKFGHIKRLKNNDTEICINGLCKNDSIPEYIIDLTLAHEIVHYIHGFQSPYERMYEHPHKGGIVRKELVKRGFKNALKAERVFLKKEWLSICKELLLNKSTKTKEKQSLHSLLRWYNHL